MSSSTRHALPLAVAALLCSHALLHGQSTRTWHRLDAAPWIATVKPHPTEENRVGLWKLYDADAVQIGDPVYLGEDEESIKATAHLAVDSLARRQFLGAGCEPPSMLRESISGDPSRSVLLRLDGIGNSQGEEDTLPWRQTIIPLGGKAGYLHFDPGIEALDERHLERVMLRRWKESEELPLPIDPTGLWRAELAQDDRLVVLRLDRTGVAEPVTDVRRPRSVLEVYETRTDGREKKASVDFLGDFRLSEDGLHVLTLEQGRLRVFLIDTLEEVFVQTEIHGFPRDAILTRDDLLLTLETCRIRAHRMSSGSNGAWVAERLLDHHLPQPTDGPLQFQSMCLQTDPAPDGTRRLFVGLLSVRRHPARGATGEATVQAFAVELDGKGAVGPLSAVSPPLATRRWNRRSPQFHQANRDHGVAYTGDLVFLLRGPGLTGTSPQVGDLDAECWKSRPELPESVPDEPLPWPFPDAERPHVAQHFAQPHGWGRNLGLHRGLDILLAPGTPVYAAEGGLVVLAEEEHLADHLQGVVVLNSTGESRRMLQYMHLEPSTIQFAVGDRVQAGELLGEVARWNYELMQYGHHLHLGLGDGAIRASYEEGGDEQPPRVAFLGLKDPVEAFEPFDDDVAPTVSDFGLYGPFEFSRIQVLEEPPWDDDRVQLDPSSLSGRVLSLVRVSDRSHSSSRFVTIPKEVTLRIRGLEGQRSTAQTVTLVKWPSGPPPYAMNVYVEPTHGPGASADYYVALEPWNTADYGSGLYRISVTATDHAGNAETRSMLARILEQGP